MSRLAIDGNYAAYTERAATLACLYRRFWAIAALHRAGRFDSDDAEAAALVEQRMICILFEEIEQGLHREASA